MFNAAEFQSKYQAFDCLSVEDIDLAYRFACALYGEFQCVDDPEVVELMTELAVAHELELEFNPIYQNGAVKRVKSLNDEIEYAKTDSDSPFSLTSTKYGSRLKKLMKLYYGYGTVSRGSNGTIYGDKYPRSNDYLGYHAH